VGLVAEVICRWELKALRPSFTAEPPKVSSTVARVGMFVPGVAVDAAVSEGARMLSPMGLNSSLADVFGKDPDGAMLTGRRFVICPMPLLVIRVCASAEDASARARSAVRGGRNFIFMFSNTRKLHQNGGLGAVTVARLEHTAAVDALGQDRQVAILCHC